MKDQTILQDKFKPKEIGGKKKDYISWHEYFMGITLLARLRSKDPVTQTGACIVDSDNKIVSIGYNGAPIGLSDDDFPWRIKTGNYADMKYPYICHAELNAIVIANPKNLRGCKIYTTVFPCNECVKLIIQSGIKEILYLSDKHSDSDMNKAAKYMIDKVGIRCIRLDMLGKKIVLDFSKDSI